MGVASNVQTGMFGAGVFSSERQETANAFIAFSPRPPIKAERLDQAHIGEPREGRCMSARQGGERAAKLPLRLLLRRTLAPVCLDVTLKN